MGLTMENNNLKNLHQEQDVRNFYDMWIQIKSKYVSEYTRLVELRTAGGATEED